MRPRLTVFEKLLLLFVVVLSVAALVLTLLATGYSMGGAPVYQGF